MNNIHDISVYDIHALVLSAFLYTGNRWEAVVSYIHSLIVIPEPHLLNY